MKMYTTPDQTAKLVELGFDKPNMALVKAESLCQSGIDFVWRTTNYEQNYSIGELIEMLPEKICIDETLYSRIIDKNDVCYYSWDLETYALLICDVKEELVDNLFDMIVKLKEEEIIYG